MWAKYTTATGALIAENISGEEPPVPADGQTVIEMPPSAVAGLSTWSAAKRGYVDPAPPMSRTDALLALLVTKGTITQGEADALPAA